MNKSVLAMKDCDLAYGSIVHNVETLVKAWNGKVPDLPDSVKTALKK